MATAAALVAQGPSSSPPSSRVSSRGASWFGLFENETLKIMRRRRPHLVLAVLIIFLAISVWAQYRSQENAIRNDFGGNNQDWRAQVEKRINDAERRSRQRRIFAAWNRVQQFEAARLRYHLERDINPNRQTGPLFSRAFAALASTLLLPLLVTVLGADLVSSETSSGTIKMLLTRPVPRWRVLTAKLIVLAGFSTLLVAAAAFFSWAIAGFAFGWRGFTAPVLTGFRFGAGGVDLSGVRAAPLWLDTLAVWGLTWFASLVVAVMVATFSVLFKSTAAAMGTFIAILAAGTLLGQIANDWEVARWIFVTNLPIAQYYSGVPPPVAGMTLASSVVVLGLWGVAAAALGLVIFSRRDVTA